MKLRTTPSFADRYVHRTATVATFCLTAACGFPRPADVPDPGVCTANEFVACEGSIVRTCNATGDGTTTQDCSAAGCNANAKRCNQCVPNADSCVAGTNEIHHCGPDGLPAGQDTCQRGCIAAPSAHCAYLEPRYLPDICDTVAAMPNFTVDHIASFDTALDTNCNGGVVNQDGGPAICVVRYDSIDITATGILTVSGVRALALVADIAVTIDGVLDVGAKGLVIGPGGSTVLSGALAGSDGGGGAGFATAGGTGGSATTDGGGGLGGGKATDPSLVTVLIGGTSPNAGLQSANPPRPGGGGGAATLIACRGMVSVSGTIDAGGGGGSGGAGGLFAGALFAGTGGGSGGNVVLQGLSIVVTGQVFANGGGGGAGLFMPSPGVIQAGGAGTNGTRSTTTAATGGVPPGTAGTGGAGGRQGTAPGFGFHPSAATGLPGGGGGSVGFFQTYTPSGVTPQLTPLAASPVFSPNKQIKTR